MENSEITPGPIAPQTPSASLHLSRPGINETIQSLIGLSKKNGYVSVQDINELIPDSATDPDLIEFIMNTLDGLDIKLLDEDEIEEHRKKVAEAEAEDARTEPNNAPYDPFKVYLKQMGRKPLLERYEEVET